MACSLIFCVRLQQLRKFLFYSYESSLFQIQCLFLIPYLYWAFEAINLCPFFLEISLSFCPASWEVVSGSFTILFLPLISLPQPNFLLSKSQGSCTCWILYRYLQPQPSHTLGFIFFRFGFIYFWISPLFTVKLQTTDIRPFRITYQPHIQILNLSGFFCISLFYILAICSLSPHIM